MHPFIEATRSTFLQGKAMAEGAMKQLNDDEEFFYCPGPRSHSIAINVKHVGGNLKSRWTSFLTSDGEKPDRNRDNEFKISAGEDRNSIFQIWNDGWNALETSLLSLSDEDLNRTVTIRNEPHSVYLAVQRSLSHTGHHIGQIMYLCRLFKKGEWNWLTIPPGGSRDFNRQKMQS